MASSVKVLLNHFKLILRYVIGQGWQEFASNLKFMTQELLKILVMIDQESREATLCDYVGPACSVDHNDSHYDFLAFADKAQYDSG